MWLVTHTVTKYDSTPLTHKCTRVIGLLLSNVEDALTLPLQMTNQCWKSKLGPSGDSVEYMLGVVMVPMNTVNAI